ncbi:cyclic nucleotide-binding domain-containing protein [Labilibaculum sp. A4]|uniref:Cyclic nucleotide-binding domain-containing protein n=2 Tax=Labilibaculum euxinus TaxID=2686357 RepID=A0A425Y069_9BACT|nr:cyclic nucleotide-binding domain-containing protein [Labilibaculum euxinus]MVB07739.1 cyclic nucleotide-binding domain-containing protein [Labilibaculum euxinus]MWN78581.1 cyclic nucleotide-binding domain-containing protein [Labilibaculum euxinus]
MVTDRDKYILDLKNKFESYSFISKKSWELLKSIIRFISLEKNDILLNNGECSKKIYFVCKGVLRAYFTNPLGDIYTKNIFLENDIAGSIVSSMLEKPSEFTLEALENTILISLDYKSYRKLINQENDLKEFYIAYLEKNWVIDKEQKEVSLILEDATERYKKLRLTHPNIDTRIAQQHIASHLGVTPTQLSRIRKNLKK